MNSGIEKLQKRKTSLKPYVYPRCCDMSVKIEKKMIKNIQYYNSYQKASRRQTTANILRDIEEHRKENTLNYKQNMMNDENKTRLIQNSRKNRLKSVISDRFKLNSLNDRISLDSEYICLQKTLIFSHNSQSSHQRLTKQYQSELKNCAQSTEKNYEYHQTNQEKHKKRTSIESVDSRSFHYCTKSENKIEENQVQKDFNEQSKQYEKNGFQRKFSKKKKINQTQKLNLNLFRRLQQMKQNKQDQRISFVVFANYKYF